MIVEVPWRKNVEDETMDGERLEGELGNEKLDMERRVLVPKRVFVSCEDLEIFGFTASFLWMLINAQGAARQAHTEHRRKRIEGKMRATVMQEAQRKGARGHLLTKQSRGEQNERDRGQVRCRRTRRQRRQRRQIPAPVGRRSPRL